MSPVSGANFRVDLRGIVDLLSHHLYSSPRVYVRELLQNAADALAARRVEEPEAPARVLVAAGDVAADGRLHCLDSGIGLTAGEVTRFLATIGASTKRDELGLARTDFLGQFGIGLLSCFLVSDEIEVVSRSARGGPPVRWVGRGDGSYTLTEITAGQAGQLLAEAGIPGVDATAWPPEQPGTWVALRPRRDTGQWLADGQLRPLAREYGQMLPWDIQVAVPDGPPRRITAMETPWRRMEAGDTTATAELAELAGVPALAVLPVRVPAAGLRGALVIVDHPAAPSARQPHRVYVRGMLVGTEVPALLPEWAFFARGVVDADQLRLTASREALYDDDLLEDVRVALGEQLRRWLRRTAEVNPELFDRFLRLHALAVKAVASTDEELLRVVLPWLRFETTAGPMTLPEVADRFGVVRYTATIDEFRQVAPVAAAQGIGVVNAGYSYDTALIERLPRVDPGITVQALIPGDLDAHVADPPEAAATALRPLVAAATAILDELEVQVRLRSFEPANLPALVLDDRNARHQRERRAVMAAEADSVWSQLLASFDDPGGGRRVLLLNHRSDTVRRIAEIDDPELLRLTVESLYCQALLAGQHPLEPADSAALHRSFRGLIDRATGTR